MEGKQNEERFSKEECQTILENTFNTNEVKYLNQEVKSLLGDVEGYLSEHLRLEINYRINNKTKTEKYFVKAHLSQPGFLNDFTKYLQIFKVETFLYKTLIKEFETFENFLPVSPICYLTKENLLVLEDLCQQGFQTIERLKPLDLNQCKISLKTLSLFHAYGLIHEELNLKKTGSKLRLNEIYPEYFEDKFYSHSKDTPSMKFYTAAMQSLIDLLDEIPEEIIPDKDSFKDALRTERNGVADEKKIEKKYPCTCIHGDLWTSNIMFKYDDDGKELLDCRLLDFQFIRYYIPSFDVLVFLFGNTTKQFRKENTDFLLRYYYDSLSSELLKHNLDLTELFTFDLFVESGIFTAPAAKIQAFCDICLLYIPDEIHLEAQHNPEMYRSILVDDRSEYVIDTYHTNKEFQQYVKDEMTELYTSLLQKKKLQDTIL